MAKKCSLVSKFYYTSFYIKSKSYFIFEKLLQNLYKTFDKNVSK